jgi:outer membrane protein TolC
MAPAPVVRQADFAVLQKEPPVVPKGKDPDFRIDLPAGTPPAPRVAPPLAPAAAGLVTPLTLTEVLQSVDVHYPLLRIAEQERSVAGGRLLSALGAFDTNLALTSTNVPLGTYENYRFVSGLTQAYTSTGLRTFANYRGGYGDFPSYSGGNKTADGGEFRAGVNLPLLRDGSIDRARANVQQAALNRDAVEPFVERQRLDFQRAAARVYWAWLAAGERLRLVRQLAKLAETRDEQIGKLVGEKLAARIDRADNLQNLLGRNAGLVDAEQAFLQATIELSLFYRDDKGQPLLANLERLPRFPQLMEPDGAELEQAVTLALDRRPELRRLRLQQQAAEVELRLAQNQMLPGLNAFVAGVTDVGAGKPSQGPGRLDRSGLEVGLEFQIPVQRSDARGRMQAAQAQVMQIAQQYKFQADLIRAEVQSAFVALERAFEQVKVATERIKYAQLVAEGERQLFKDGLSELIRVNIREQSAFDAEIIAVQAKQNYFRALAEYKAALGLTGP